MAVKKPAKAGRWKKVKPWIIGGVAGAGLMYGVQQGVIPKDYIWRGAGGIGGAYAVTKLVKKKKEKIGNLGGFKKGAIAAGFGVGAVVPVAGVVAEVASNPEARKFIKEKSVNLYNKGKQKWNDRKAR
ncbi:MAG: hypothetical protein WC602_04255 [archaeon]